MRRRPGAGYDMIRMILRVINAPTLILFAALGIALQTALFQYWVLQLIQPDLLLILVIWCALKREFTEGGLITLIVSDIAELHSASPQGLFLVVYMGTYLTLRGTSRYFIIPNPASMILLTVIAFIFSKLLGLFALAMMGASSPPFRHLATTLFPGAVSEAAWSWAIYPLLERFDQATYHRDAGAEINEWEWVDR